MKEEAFDFEVILSVKSGKRVQINNKVVKLKKRKGKEKH